MGSCLLNKSSNTTNLKIQTQACGWNGSSMSYTYTFSNLKTIYGISSINHGYDGQLVSISKISIDGNKINVSYRNVGATTGGYGSVTYTAVGI